MKGLAGDVLSLLRVFAILLGVALGIGALAILLGEAGEFARARPVVALAAVAAAGAGGLALRRGRGGADELVIDLTDEGPTDDAPQADDVRSRATASRR